MNKPNLFILGAGKSGTTSLYHLLGRHRDFKVSEIKEPSFFCSHFQIVKNPIQYFNLFGSAAKYRVDSSHVYFSNPETAPVLQCIFPDAKFIITLRHPKARAHSLYQQMRRITHRDGRPMELSETFYQALQLEGERFTSDVFRAECRHYFYNFMYMRSSCYDDQIIRYFNLFPRQQFLVTTLAEIRKDPTGVIAAIGDFLDVDVAGFGAEMPVVNVAPAYDALDSECDNLMEAHFGDLTARVDQIVGRCLDWSL